MIEHMKRDPRRPFLCSNITSLVAGVFAVSVMVAAIVLAALG